MVGELRGAPPGRGGAQEGEVGGAGAWRPLARALLDHHRGAPGAVVRVRSDLGDVEEVPAALFFRGPDALLPCDRAALRLARGRVLDVGAGAGAIALALQARGHAVTAIETMPEAVEVMRHRGVADARLQDVFSLPSVPPYETVILLMNGAGLAGTLRGLVRLLRALADVTAEGGQVLVDSTDVRRLAGGERRREDGRYVGELHYQLEYRGERGEPFPQLFVDADTFRVLAERGGWTFQVAHAGGEGEPYLARLERPSPEA